MSKRRHIKFWRYYKEWIETYKDGQIQDVTYAKYLMVQEQIKNLVPDLYLDEMTRRDVQAERKKKKQDFTPQSVSNLMSALVGKNPSGTYYEPAAGTGGILITRWWSDCLEDPVHLSKVDKKVLDQNPGISFFTYDPRNYWYQVEEMSDRAIPFLIFNMAIRGMNGVAVQCNSLSREAKEAYFIRNDSDNFLGFSKVIKLPHTKDVGQELHINKWVTQFSKG